MKTSKHKQMKQDDSRNCLLDDGINSLSKNNQNSQQLPNNNKQSNSFLQDVAKSLTIEHSTFNNSAGGASDEDNNKLETTSGVVSSQDQTVQQQQNNDEVEYSNIFVWGNNQHGQLSLSQESMPLVQDPVAIKLSKINKIESIACGNAHVLILTDTGSVFALGDNSYGQLGLSKAFKQSSR